MCVTSQQGDCSALPGPGTRSRTWRALAPCTRAPTGRARSGRCAYDGGMTSQTLPVTDPAFDPFAATGRTLGWGVVSTGAIARKVTPDITGMQDARLVGVSSRSQESAEQFAHEFGAQKAYGGSDGLERMLADPEVEVVYVATPHGQHHEHITAALEAGKHVVSEKAFTITAREAREVADLAREKNLFLMEGLWTRFMPLRARVAQLLEAGEIGPVRWVQANLGARATSDSEHRLWRVDAGGGALLDLGCYVLHWPWLAMGVPESFSARTVKRGQVDGLTSITAFYPEGAAQMTASLVSVPSKTAVISGEQGVITVHGPLHKSESFTLARPDGTETTEAWPLAGVGYVYEMREATRCIQEGLLESPTMPLADTVAQMEWFDQIREQIGLAYPGHE